MDDAGAGERIARVEALIDAAERLPDASARDVAMELVQALLELYGEGLARIVERVDGAAERLLDDELVTHLLLLHDLHPVPLEERVLGALEEVRPYMESHRGGVQLVGIVGDVVHLRLEGSCSGCPSSTATLELAVEEAIRKAAPEVGEVVAEGALAAPSLALQVKPAAAGWAIAGSLAQLAGGGADVRRVEDEEVLFVRVGGSDYAYRPACPGCGDALAGDALHGAELACRACGLSFDVIRAGRCHERPELQLEPLPLLVTDAGLVKVALGVAAA